MESVSPTQPPGAMNCPPAHTVHRAQTTLDDAVPGTWMYSRVAHTRQAEHRASTNSLHGVEEYDPSEQAVQGVHRPVVVSL